MIKRYVAMPLLGVVLGGICLSASQGYNNYSSPTSNTPQNVRPGVSDESYDPPPPPDNQATGREEIAYLDERDQDIHHRANRKGDWGYKQNWRYDRQAFYKGETQGEAYDREHPDGIGGIGMDPDREYLQMRKYYLEESKRQQQNAQSNRNSKDHDARSYANQRNENNSYRNGQVNSGSYRNGSNDSELGYRDNDSNSRNDKYQENSQSSYSDFR